MLYTISNGILTVTANSFGAELTSVKKGEREYLWQNDNGEWDGHAPVIFPYCGHIRIKDGEKNLPVNIHGVASLCNFALTYRDEKTLRFSVASSDFTKKYYPYDFIFDVIYSIEGDVLKIDHEVVNPSEKEMYFYLGGHESYNTLTELENCVVEFEKEEKLENLLNDTNGYLTGKIQNMGEGKILDFKEYILDNDETFAFSNIKSRKVIFKWKDGKKIAETTFNGFPNLMFWRPTGAKTLCIEPWLNLPDMNNGEYVDIKDRKGALKLARGEKKIFSRTIKYFN